MVSFFLESCSKSDWRDTYIGSYNGLKRHEYKSVNYVTGQAYNYVIDSVDRKNPINISVIKNEKSDQVILHINGLYVCDADKDGYSTNSNIKIVYRSDSFRVEQYVPADTIHFGRYVYMGAKN